MYSVRKITEDTLWIGGSDRRLSLFESIYPVPDGVSYNSYLVLDTKTVLIDTVDHSISNQFFDNLSHALNGRKLDYVVINHMEPDHAATLAEVVLRYPDVRIIGNQRTFNMMCQFFDFSLDGRAEVVDEGSSINLGKHTLSFYMAPMVHWPEAMVCYDSQTGALFSADAFGCFGALDGAVFADEVDFEHCYLSEARRYYANIVGAYGNQVIALLDKAAALDISYICPLHGFVWRDNISWFIHKYKKWALWAPEDNGVVIVYGSIYGGTENAADILASELRKKGIKDVHIYDAARIDVSFLVAEAFRAGCLVLASSTYNGGIFTPVKNYLDELKTHNIRSRTVAVIENGSWAPVAGSLIQERLSQLTDIQLIQPVITIKSTIKESERSALEVLAEKIRNTIK